MTIFDFSIFTHPLLVCYGYSYYVISCLCQNFNACIHIHAPKTYNIFGQKCLIQTRRVFTYPRFWKLNSVG